MEEENCIAQLTDVKGIVWQFEGWVKNGNDTPLPIWSPEPVAVPKLMSESTAYQIAVGMAGSGDIPSIKKV